MKIIFRHYFYVLFLFVISCDPREKCEITDTCGEQPDRCFERDYFFDEVQPISLSTFKQNRSELKDCGHDGSIYDSMQNCYHENKIIFKSLKRSIAPCFPPQSLAIVYPEDAATGGDAISYNQTWHLVKKMGEKEWWSQSGLVIGPDQGLLTWDEGKSFCEKLGIQNEESGEEPSEEAKWSYSWRLPSNDDLSININSAGLKEILIGHSSSWEDLKLWSIEGDLVSDATYYNASSSEVKTVNKLQKLSVRCMTSY